MPIDAHPPLGPQQLAEYGQPRHGGAWQMGDQRVLRQQEPDQRFTGQGQATQCPGAHFDASIVDGQGDWVTAAKKK